MLKGCKNACYSATKSSYDESGWSLAFVRQCGAKIKHFKQDTRDCPEHTEYRPTNQRGRFWGENEDGQQCRKR